MLFYAPARGISEAHNQAALAPAALLALLAQSINALWSFSAAPPPLSNPLLFISLLFGGMISLLFMALALVPTLIFISNLFERRGSFRLVVQQEYAPATTAVFYAWAAANLAVLPLTVIARAAGLQDAFVQWYLRTASQAPPDMPLRAAVLNDPQQIAQGFPALLLLPLFGFWLALAVRAAFHLTTGRSVAVLLLSGLVLVLAWSMFGGLFITVLASPFLLLLLFFFLRGYFGELVNAQRARASFKQNLEAATLNPADASAHYNLGLIHLQRNELDKARERFERAIEIDADEVDAHYQLGRISRMQNRLPDAIKHFEQTVARDPQHAQHEVWREIGATYIAAGQYTDARDALERFLERRSSDAEGLYLMGRALAGLGRQREAAESMQACIEAVKTAPAYKYRAEKRWLNEAQAFLRSQA